MTTEKVPETVPHAKGRGRFQCALALACCAISLGVWAAGYTWIGPAGGKWSEAANWMDTDTHVKGVGVPTASHLVTFDICNGAVNIDTDCACSRLSIVTTATGTNVTLTGTGSLSVAGGSSSHVHSNRTLTVDCAMTVESSVYVYGAMVTEGNADLTLKKTVYLGKSNARFISNGGVTRQMGFREDSDTANAQVIINGGSVTNSGSNWTYPSSNMKLVVNGGLFLSGIDFDRSGTDIELNGGTLRFRTEPYDVGIHDNAKFVFNGGRLIYPIRPNNYVTNICFLGLSTNCTLDAIGDQDRAIMPDIAAGDTVAIHGLAMATNGSSAAFYLDRSATVAGEGKIVASRFTVNRDHTLEASSVVNLRLKGGLVLGGANNGLYATNSATTVNVPDGLLFGAFRDWKVYTGNTSPYVTLAGLIRMDTLDYFDKTSVHNIALRSIQPDPSTAFAVYGGGTAELHFRDVWPGLTGPVTVGADTELLTTGKLRVSRLTLGEGALLTISNNTGRVLASDASLADTARIRLYSEAATASTTNRPILSLRPGSAAAARLPDIVTFDGPGYATRPHIIDGSIFYAVDVATEANGEWTGGEDGYFDKTGNWTGTSVPGAGEVAYFGGLARTTVTNRTDDLSLKQLYFKASAAPFRLVGKPITLTSTDSTTETAAIVSKSRNPVVIEADISHGSGNMYVNPIRDSYVELAGKTTTEGLFGFVGNVRVSGELTAGNIRLEYSSAMRSADQPYDSQLHVLDGGTVSISAADIRIVHKLPFRIDAGGHMSIAGKGFGWGDKADRNTIGTMYVDGTLDITAPLDGYKEMQFIGSGRVDLKGGADASDATRDIVLIGHRDGLTCGIAGWHSAVGAKVVRLVAENQVRLVALADGTYGPDASAASGSTAQDRALQLRSFATLEVHTSDPDAAEPVARTLTFVDPIVGDGALVKKGAGTLVLASAENAITGGVTIAEGTLAWTAEQDIPGPLTAQAGTTLKFGATDGMVLPLACGGDVTLAGATLEPYDAAARAAVRARDEASWQTILSVSEGAKIVSLPTVDERFRLRVTETAGGHALQISRAPDKGMRLIFR